MQDKINVVLLGGKIINSGLNPETRVILIQTFRKHSKNDLLDVSYVIKELYKLLDVCTNEERRQVARLIAYVEYESDIATDRILNLPVKTNIFKKLFKK